MVEQWYKKLFERWYPPNMSDGGEEAILYKLQPSETTKKFSKGYLAWKHFSTEDNGEFIKR